MSKCLVIAGTSWHACLPFPICPVSGVQTTFFCGKTAIHSCGPLQLAPESCCLDMLHVDAGRASKTRYDEQLVQHRCLITLCRLPACLLAFMHVTYAESRFLRDRKKAGCQGKEHMDNSVCSLQNPTAVLPDPRHSVKELYIVIIA